MKQTVFQLLHDRLESRAGLSRPPAPKFRLEDLERSEWSPQFEQLMRNRLIMGALRYGRLGAAGKKQYDRVASITKRIALYGATGNLEHLVDVANEALLEFVESRHPKRHWGTADGDGAYHTPHK